MSGSATSLQTDRMQAGWSITWLGALLCFIGACLLFSINIDRFPHPDELYHILAARGLLESGEPRIAEGVYERVFAHTWLIARLFDAFGESLFVARLPSIVSIAATVALLYFWLCRYAGFQAAIIGSVLFAVSPFAVDIAQFVRFYGLQTVTFFAGAVCVFAAVGARRADRWLWAVSALPLLAAALYFQKTTAIGIVGLLIWGSLRIGFPWMRSSGIESGRKIVWLISLSGFGLIALGAAWQLGLIQDAWQTYRTVPLFNRANANQFWFYHAWYNLLYPSLWPALGLIGLAALANRPGPAFFAATIFIVSFLLNSFAAPKSLRYLIYAQPFAFALLGIGLSTILRPVATWLNQLVERFSRTIPIEPVSARRVSLSLVCLSLIILVIGNPAFIRTGTLLAGIAIPPEKPSVDWLAAESELKPHLEAADVVLTQAELEMLYYYDRYDILLSASRLSEIPDGKDFSLDFRTGRPVIASVAALNTVFRCFNHGIFVTNKRRWGASNVISRPLMEAIEQNTTPLNLPASSRVIAMVWTLPDGTKSRLDCPELPHRRGSG